MTLNEWKSCGNRDPSFCVLCSPGRSRPRRAAREEWSCWSSWIQRRKRLTWHSGNVPQRIWASIFSESPLWWLLPLHNWQLFQHESSLWTNTQIAVAVGFLTCGFSASLSYIHGLLGFCWSEGWRRTPWCCRTNCKWFPIIIHRSPPLDFP